jgi:hypothetical protein
MACTLHTRGQPPFFDIATLWNRACVYLLHFFLNGEPQSAFLAFLLVYILHRSNGLFLPSSAPNPRHFPADSHASDQ